MKNLLYISIMFLLICLTSCNLFDSMVNKISDLSSKIKDKVNFSSTVENIKDYSIRIKENVIDYSSKLKENVGDYSSVIKENAIHYSSKLKENVVEYSSFIKESAVEYSSQIKGSVNTSFSSIKDKAVDLSSFIKEKAKDYGEVVNKISYFSELFEASTDKSEILKLTFLEIVKRTIPDYTKFTSKNKISPYVVTEQRKLNYSLLLRGIFEALSSVSLERNICYFKTGKFDTSIFQAFNDVFESFEKMTNVNKTTKKLFKVLNELSKYFDTCGIKSLLGKLTSLSGYIGATKLAYRLFYYSSSISEVLTNFRSNYEKADSLKLGHNIGTVIKILLEFSNE
jgi:hypothetical protein